MIPSARSSVGASRSRRRAEPQQLPLSAVAQAVRLVLTSSTAAFALLGAGVAQAADCSPGAPQAACSGSQVAADVAARQPVHDLTAVAGSQVPASVSPGNGGAAHGIADSGTAEASGDDIGIYIVSDGNITLRNRKAIEVASESGLADAIFVSAHDIALTNSGDLDVHGFSWGAGIEAQAAGANTITNSGAVDVLASANEEQEGGGGGPYGHGYGIYATSNAGDLAVHNLAGGNLHVRGPYATAIHAYNSHGHAILIDNAAAITATTKLLNPPDAETTDYGGFATGIRATTSLAGSKVDVASSGDITVEGGLSANAIDVMAAGQGNAATVANTGVIHATAGAKYQSAGVVVSAGGDARMDNSGTVVVRGKYAYGAQVLAQGAASASNSGDIQVRGSGFGVYDVIRGIDAESATGLATATNTGSVEASGGNATAIFAAGASAIARNNGDAMVARDVNDGVSKYGIGVYAHSQDGKAVADNTGSISALGSVALGIVAVTDSGSVAATNSGDITVGKSVASYGIMTRATHGNVQIRNTSSGSIDVLASNGAYGIVGWSQDGNVGITNDGDVTAEGVASPTGGGGPVWATAGRAETGSLKVSNTGTISASNTVSDAIGMHLQSQGNLTATNSAKGSIDVLTTGAVKADGSQPNALGIQASSYGGDAVIRNDGAIHARSEHGIADAIFIGQDKVNVRNNGDLSATGASWAAGIEAQGIAGNSVTHAGSITATALNNDETAGYGHAYGIYATGGQGSTKVATLNGSRMDVIGPYSTGIHAYNGYGGALSVSNAGDISTRDKLADGEELFGYSTGIHAVTSLEGSSITIRNSGSVATRGFWGASGIDAQGLGNGTAADIVNSGDIEVTASQSPAMGIYVTTTGATRVNNSGTIAMPTGGFAINAIIGDANLRIDNSGMVDVANAYYSFGVQALGGAKVQVDNSGVIAAGGEEGGGVAFGILARGAGATTVNNRGTIDTYGAFGYGMQAISEQTDVLVTNSAIGTVDTRAAAIGVGMLAAASNSLTGNNSEVRNAGEITMEADAASVLAGAVAQSRLGNATVINTGTVRSTNGNGSAAGLQVSANKGTGTVTNSGTIDVHSTDGKATGVIAFADRAVVNNRGDISATTTTDNPYQAVGLDVFTGTSAQVTNSGSIVTRTSNGSGIAVWVTSGGSLQFRNTGTLEGRVITSAGDNSFTNDGGSQWTLERQSTDFAGSGNQLHNMAGSVIHLADGRIGMGIASRGFRNDGAIRVNGDSTIDMGANQAQGPSRPGFATFDRTGPGRGAAPLVNDGTIDLSATSAQGNRLSVLGDLAGDGVILLDGAAADGKSGMHISGDVREQARQRIDVALAGLPDKASGTDATLFAKVDGYAARKAFTAGHVVGQKAGNFVNLQVDVDQVAGSADGAGTVYQASVQANGLNPTGQLAASMGAGVQNLLSSQIGSFRQRGGAVPDADGSQRAMAYVRGFGGNGNTTAGLGQNFGGTGSIGMRQSNNGTELGLSSMPLQGWTFGMTMGKSDGQQNLTSGGFGMTRFNADSAGVFATWQTPRGFYVDTSAWSMRYAGRLDSAAGRQAVHGSANAVNLESGYTFKLGNGLNIEPQLQYTLTRVDGMRLQGPDAQFDADASQWARSRLSVMAWKPVTGRNGILWMPYASASAVHMGGAGTRYSINQDYLGSMNMLGNSTLVEAGLGMRKQGFSANAGLSWTQGDRIDSDVASQLRLNYSW